MALQAGKVGVYPQDLDKEGHIKQQTPVDPYVLPVASPTTLGGVKPVAKTEGMTQDVGVDEEGKLYVPGGSGISKIYTKTFEFNSTSGLGTGFRMTAAIDVAGYTPIGLVVRDKSSGYYAVGSLYKNRDGDEKTKGIMYTGSAGSNFQAIVYYVKNGDIETLS